MIFKLIYSEILSLYRTALVLKTLNYLMESLAFVLTPQIQLQKLVFRVSCSACRIHLLATIKRSKNLVEIDSIVGSSFYRPPPILTIRNLRYTLWYRFESKHRQTSFCAWDQPSG